MCRTKITLEEIVKEYENALLAFTISRCQIYKVADKDFAKSHLQDCYLKFNKILDTINNLDEKHRLNYLLTVTKNAMIDKLRRNGRINYDSDFIDDRNILLMSNEHHSLENQDLIDKMMSTLTPEQQTILDLHLQGYSYKEISEKMDLPVRTVGVKLFRLKEKLRQKFGHLKF